MSKPLSELKKKLSPAVLDAAREKTVAMLAEMSLAETRRAMGMNLEALGGKLEINAAFPDGKKVQITQFSLFEG